MKLGIGSYTFPFGVSSGRLTHFDLLEKAVLLRAEVVQFCENLPLATLSRKELSELIERASDAGIRLEVGTRGVDVPNIAYHAQMARRLGSSFVRVVVDDRSSVRSMAAIERDLKACLDVCDGVVIAIENHDHLRASELESLVEALGPERCGITLDTANSLGCLEGTNEVADRLARFTRCLHIKDVKATRVPSNLGFTVVGTCPGEGSVDIPRVLNQMTPLCQSVILEQWPPNDPGGTPLVDLENAWAAEGFAYLQRLIQDPSRLVHS